MKGSRTRHRKGFDVLVLSFPDMITGGKGQVGESRGAMISGIVTATDLMSWFKQEAWGISTKVPGGVDW